MCFFTIAINPVYEPISHYNRLNNMLCHEPISRYNRLMMKYNWQKPDWPNFQYDLLSVHETLFSIAEKTGLIRGKLIHLTEDLQTEAMMNVMVEEAVKASASDSAAPKKSI